MKSLVVYCGSSFGNEIDFRNSAKQVGETLAKRDITLIYGGSNVGLMGAMADAAIAMGGKVIGVMPEFLSAKEIAHTNLSELILVATMHERKKKMSDLSDGIIALPGGFGTMEELFEMLTWSQLGLHHKPIGLLNINGFYDSLLELIRLMVEKGFLKSVNLQLFMVSDNIGELLEMMKNYTPAKHDKWIVNPN